jgi:hypothetical protein
MIGLLGQDSQDRTVRNRTGRTLQPEEDRQKKGKQNRIGEQERQAE